MINLNEWYAGTTSSVTDRIAVVGAAREEALDTIDKLVGDLVDFAVGQGYTVQQARYAVEDLFRTFVSDWFLYTLIGSNDIVTAITNDATLAWLDIDAGGQTIRTRLISRLS